MVRTYLMSLSSSTPAYTLTADMFKPLTDAVAANVPVLVTVGVTVFGIIASVGIIPKIFRKFI